MATDDVDLTTELGIFRQRRAEWLHSNPSEFVVIAGATVVGFHPDYASAFKAGLHAVGINGVFLVKQVSAEEPVYVIY